MQQWKVLLVALLGWMLDPMGVSCCGFGLTVLCATTALTIDVMDDRRLLSLFESMLHQDHGAAFDGTP